MATSADNWFAHNQAYLVTSLARLRGILQRYVNRSAAEASASIAPAASIAEPVTTTASGSPAALVTLRTIFGLSAFEQDLLLLAASVDLDSSFGALCAAAQGDAQRPYATFSLALAALPEAHWNALTPAAPLRRWRLLELLPGASLTLSPLRISERVLHYIAGIQHLDERLMGLFFPVSPAADLAPSHQQLVAELATSWAHASSQHLPAIQLCGDERGATSMIAAALCARLGLKLYSLMAEGMPTSPTDLEPLVRLWERESLLTRSALYIDCSFIESGDATRLALIARLIDRLNGALIIGSRERIQMAQRPLITSEVHKPAADEQRALWRSALGAHTAELNGQIDELVTQFNLSAQAIRAASLAAAGSITHRKEIEFSKALWEACRSEARPRMDDLAQRIEPAASWPDLVLPAPQLATLRTVASQVRHRARVYEQWGFAARSSRGLGISALFAGQSGTGKTMAAEVLAGELELDLYRIDLSAVVSKYIGETEKNLRRIFDAAEEGGAILLFDEADALFGKRSEVKDSHDRYANIEVSYLLQRMEAYHGLAILTTNMKQAIDPAFLRRIRFVVQFPFPDAAQRAEIWRRIFPSSTPTADLDFERLAQLSVPGGNIRTIALNAAFLAAADPTLRVRMDHIRRAAYTEYAKLEKTLTDAELAGWPID